MMASPKVTIGMPVYNSKPDKFRVALQALLEQTFGDFELIISDNGSDNEARALYEHAAASDARVRYVRHPQNYGATFNFNFVFAQAQGEYFMWAADDDVRAHTYLEKTVALLETHPGAVSASTRIGLARPDGRRLGEMPVHLQFNLPRPSQRIIGPMEPYGFMDIYALHRRSALAKTRLCQPVQGGDALLVMEMLLQGTIERVDEELFVYIVPEHHMVSDHHTTDTFATMAFGSMSRPVLIKYPLQNLALQMLLAVATNNVDLSPRERYACLTTLTKWLVWRGWLTNELRMVFRHRAQTSLRDQRYLDAMADGIKWAVLSPVPHVLQHLKELYRLRIGAQSALGSV